MKNSETDHRSGLDRFVYYFLTVLIPAGIIIDALLPWIMRYLVDGAQTMADQQYRLLVLPIMAAGIFAIMILWELHRIMKTVVSGTCFISDNVERLHHLGVYALIIFVIVLLRCLIFPTLTAITITAVFLIAGLFSFVLERVFRQAVSYKEDDGLTI